METINFNAMLQEAITMPGKAMEGYRLFHNYSPCNQWLAIMQAPASGASPINPFKGWQALGRQVKKGAKAISLFVPSTFEKENENGETDTFTKFFMRRRWFYLHDTEGAEYTAPNLPAFDYAKALESLSITQEAFNHVSGNVQGYAHGKTITINPLAQCPEKTILHEIAHIVLGHTSTGATMQHGESLPADLKEVEAESTAYLVAAALGIGAEKLAYSRAYIQGWLGGGKVPEASQRRIFSAAGKILKAGAGEKQAVIPTPATAPAQKQFSFAL